MTWSRREFPELSYRSLGEHISHQPSSTGSMARFPSQVEPAAAETDLVEAWGPGNPQ
jgi:hypothetical protein